MLLKAVLHADHYAKLKEVLDLLMHDTDLVRHSHDAFDVLGLPALYIAAAVLVLLIMCWFLPFYP